MAAALLWGAALFKAPKSWPAAGLLWAAWLGWTALCALASPAPLRSLAAFSHEATAVLFFTLACSWSEADKRKWFWLLCAAGAVLALAAFRSEGLRTFTLPHPDMAGLLPPNRNYTACVEAMVFSAGLGALGQGYPKSRNERRLSAAAMALALLEILAVKSRGALLGCLAAAVIWLWRKGYRRSLWALALAPVLAFFLTPARILDMYLKFYDKGAYIRPSIWSAAAASANERVLFGQGPGRFEDAFLRHNFPTPEGYSPTRYGLRATHAHSEFLERAAETGWLGMGLYLAALALSWSLAWRRPAAWDREAGLSAFHAVTVITLFDNIPLPLLSFLYFSALAAACGKGGAEPPAKIWRPLCVGGLLLALGAWWPDWAVVRWRNLAYGYGGQEGLHQIRRALGLDPGNAGLWEDLARLHLRQSPPQGDEALKALAQAERLSPTNALYPLMEAEILRPQRRWGELIARADLALSLEPDCPQGRLLRAEALFRLGRRKEARREFAAMKLPGPGMSALRGYDALVLYFDAARYREISKLLGVNSAPRGPDPRRRSN